MKTLAQLNSRDEFGFWLQQNGYTGIGVEIGTYFGFYALQLAEHWHAGRIVTIDPYDWFNDPNYVDGCRRDWSKTDRVVELDPEYVRQEAERRTSVWRHISMVRQRSVDAATMYADGTLDFVYIDGNHAEEAVRADIDAWFPKVRKGGIFAGHDFMLRDDALQKCGVLNAVWDLADKLGRRPRVTQCTSWWFQL